MKKGFIKGIAGSALAVFATAAIAAPVSAVPGARVEIMAGMRPVGATTQPFVKEVFGAPGDEFEVQMYIRNTGSASLDEVAVMAVLPRGMTLVSNSTILWNNSNPDGLNIRDITEWRGIGGYGIYDGTGQNDGTRGSATVRYRVRVNSDGFTPGARYILNISNQAAGYIDGTLVTDTHVYYTAVSLDGAGKPAGPGDELPQTGAAEIAGAVLGLGSIATAATYYVRSRRKK